MVYDVTMLEAFYAAYKGKVEHVRAILKRPLTLAEKILYAHLYDVADLKDYKRGEDYVNFRPDRVAMQDATAQMALLQFMNAGKDQVAVPSTVHCDHLIQAYKGAKADIATARLTNEEGDTSYDTETIRIGGIAVIILIDQTPVAYSASTGIQIVQSNADYLYPSRIRVYTILTGTSVSRKTEFSNKMSFTSCRSYILTFPIYESRIRGVVVKLVYMRVIQVGFIVCESGNTGGDISGCTVCIVRKVEVYLTAYSICFKLGIQCFHHGGVGVLPTHGFKITLPHDAAVTCYMTVRFIEWSNLIDTGIMLFFNQVFHHCGEVFSKFFIVIYTGNPTRINVITSCITQEMLLTIVNA